MDRFLNDSISFQAQDEIFAEGLAKLMQANIFQYMAKQRQEQQESDRQGQELRDTLDHLTALLEEQNAKQSELQDRYLEEIQTSIRTVSMQSKEQSEKQDEYLKEMQESIRTELLQSKEQLEKQDEHLKEMQEGIRTELLQSKEQLEKQDKHLKEMQESIRKDLIHMETQYRQQSDGWGKNAYEIKNAITNVSDEIQTIKTVLNAQAEEQARAKAAQDMLDAQLSQLKKEIEEFHEFQDEWHLYHQYQDWQPAGQLHLPFPKKDSFIDFIISCTFKDTVKYIFQSAEGSIWELPTQDIEMLDRLIDFCIHMQNRIYGKKIYSRRSVEIGENFSLYFHQNHSDDPAVGTIDQVLLRGVMENSSAICKSYVRVRE